MLLTEVDGGGIINISNLRGGLLEEKYNKILICFAYVYIIYSKCVRF